MELFTLQHCSHAHTLGLTTSDSRCFTFSSRVAGCDHQVSGRDVGQSAGQSCCAAYLSSGWNSIVVQRVCGGKHRSIPWNPGQSSITTVSHCRWWTRSCVNRNTSTVVSSSYGWKHFLPWILLWILKYIYLPTLIYLRNINAVLLFVMGYFFQMCCLCFYWSDSFQALPTTKLFIMVEHIGYDISKLSEFVFVIRHEYCLPVVPLRAADGSLVPTELLLVTVAL